MNMIRGAYNYLRPFINDFLLGGILIFLPLSIKITNIFIILLLVRLIFFKKHDSVLGSLAANWVAVLVNILPFLLIVLTLIYSSEPSLGLKSIEKYLPIFLFPFLFIFVKTSLDHKFLLRAFAFCIVVCTVICLAYNLFIFLLVPIEEQFIVGDAFNTVDSNWTFLTNGNLVRPLDIHPIYLSLYISFAILVLVFDEGIRKPYKIAMLIFLFLFNIILGSRLGIVSMGILTISIGFIYFRKFGFPVVLGILAVALSVFFITKSNPILWKRYISDLSSARSPKSVSEWNGANMRFAIWHCSIEAFSESAVIGYGIGDQYDERQKCYQGYSFYGPFGTDLNSHNQFLEYGLIGGVILMSMFFLQIAYSIKLALKKQNYIHLFFVLIFVVTCLGESLLERHKGIVFFSYFNSLFVFMATPNKQKADDKRLNQRE